VEGSVFGAVSLWFLCMKYIGNRWTDLRQIHMEEVFNWSLARTSLKVKVKGQGHQWKNTACLQFVFGKTSLGRSLNIIVFKLFDITLFE